MKRIKIKRLLQLLLAGSMMFITVCCTNRIVSDNLSRQSYSGEEVEQNYSVDDTSENKPVLLPFNTKMQELAPAIWSGCLLYHTVNKKQKVACHFSVIDDDSYLDNINENNYLKHLKNVYLNFGLDGKIVLLNTVDTETGNKQLLTGFSVFLSDVKELEPFEYNIEGYSTGRGTISPDGKLLVFSSDRPHGKGNVDLWMCRNVENQWLRPKNLGNLINTSKDEVMPCFDSNNRLYFASEGHKGQGGFDLFYTDLKDGKFTAPVNMGSSINSKNNEKGICFSSKTAMCYFSSDRRGNYDIYAYKMKPESIEESEEVLPNTEEHLEKEIKTVAKELFVSDTVQDNTPVKTELVSETKQPVTSDKEIAEDMQQESVAFLEKQKMHPEKFFYAVQVIAICPETYAKHYYERILDPREEYFVVRENGWVKININKRFSSYEKAYKYAQKSRVGKFYVVCRKPEQIREYL